jgi:methionyl-tRNA formyltransferase
LDFSWDDRKIYNYVRALTKPYPGAFFRHDGRTVIVWDAEMLNTATSECAGRFSIDADNQRLLVSTGNGRLLGLKRLQIAGMPEAFGHECFDMMKAL